MTSEQRRLVALIVVAVVTVVGGLGGFIAWSAAHRDEVAAASADVPTAVGGPSAQASVEVATEAPAPTTRPTQVDGYSSGFEATDAQKEAAVRAATALAQWSQGESAQDRARRLEALVTEKVASQEVPWQKLYGAVPGASVSVDSAGEASTSSNDGTTIGVGVMVTYTVHIPHDDGTEATTHQTGLWVISMPVTATDTTKATAAQWPSV